MLHIKKIFIRFINSIKKDLIYILGNYGLRIASLVFTIVVAKNISPENYGLFGLATLIITYITYFNLGSQYSINKELSIDITNNKVVTYGLINTSFFSLLVIIFGFVCYKFGFFFELRPYLYYLILYPILFNILEISNGILRAHDKSNQLGIIKLSGTILVVSITIYYFFKGVPDDPSPLFSRFLLFQAIEVVVSLYFMIKVISIGKINFRHSFNPKYIKYLIIQGIVLSLYVTIDSFTKSIDRLFIASFYSKAELGYYTFGVSLQGPFLLAIGSIMYMDFSRMLKKFSGASKKEFKKLVKTLYKKLFLIWVITLFGAVVFGFIFLKYFLPNYMPSYLVVCIYIFNYSLRILIFPYSSYYISNGYTFDLIKIIAIPNLINIALSFTVVLLNLHYSLILIATFPSNLLYFYLIKASFTRKFLSDEIKP